MIVHSSSSLPSVRTVQQTAGLLAVIVTLVAIAIILSQPSYAHVGVIVREAPFCILAGTAGALFLLWGITTCLRCKAVVGGEPGAPKGQLTRYTSPKATDVGDPTIICVPPTPRKGAAPTTLPLPMPQSVSRDGPSSVGPSPDPTPPPMPSDALVVIESPSAAEPSHLVTIFTNRPSSSATMEVDGRVVKPLRKKPKQDMVAFRRYLQTIYMAQSRFMRPFPPPVVVATSRALNNHSHPDSAGFRLLSLSNGHSSVRAPASAAMSQLSLSPGPGVEVFSLTNGHPSHADTASVLLSPPPLSLGMTLLLGPPTVIAPPLPAPDVGLLSPSASVLSVPAPLGLSISLPTVIAPPPLPALPLSNGRTSPPPSTNALSAPAPLGMGISLPTELAPPLPALPLSNGRTSPPPSTNALSAPAPLGVGISLPTELAPPLPALPQSNGRSTPPPSTKALSAPVPLGMGISLPIVIAPPLPLSNGRSTPPPSTNALSAPAPLGMDISLPTVKTLPAPGIGSLPPLSNGHPTPLPTLSFARPESGLAAVSVPPPRRDSFSLSNGHGRGHPGFGTSSHHHGHHLHGHLPDDVISDVRGMTDRAYDSKLGSDSFHVALIRDPAPMPSPVPQRTDLVRVHEVPPLDLDRLLNLAAELVDKVCVALIHIDPHLDWKTRHSNVGEKVTKFQQAFKAITKFAQDRFKSHYDLHIKATYSGPFFDLFGEVHVHELMQKHNGTLQRQSKLSEKVALSLWQPLVEDPPSFPVAVRIPEGLKALIAVPQLQRLVMEYAYEDWTFERLRTGLTMVDPLAYVKEFAEGSKWLGLPTMGVTETAESVLNSVQFTFDERTPLLSHVKGPLVQMIVQMIDQIYNPISHAFEKKNFRYVIKAILISRTEQLGKALLAEHDNPDDIMTLVHTHVDLGLKQLLASAAHAEDHADHAAPLEKLFTPVQNYHAPFYRMVCRLRSQDLSCKIADKDVAALAKLRVDRVDPLFWNTPDPKDYPGIMAPMKEYHDAMVAAEPLLLPLVAPRDMLFRIWDRIKKGMPVSPQENFQTFELSRKKIAPMFEKFIPHMVHYIPFTLVETYHVLSKEALLLQTLMPHFLALKAVIKSKKLPDEAVYSAMLAMFEPIVNATTGILSLAIQKEYNEQILPALSKLQPTKPASKK